MGSGGWLPPQEQPQMAATEGFHAGWRGAGYELRPLSLGEILDRTFAVYRGNFWLFAGISALSGSVQLIANMIQLLVYRGMVVIPRTGTFQMGFQFGMRQAGGGISSVLFFLATAVTQAATVWALSEVYLGRGATIGNSLRAVLRKWYRFVGIGLWQGWSLLWLPLLLIVPGVILIPTVPRLRWLAVTLILLGSTAGVVVGVIFFLRNMLAVQAAVVERLEVRAAMRRSKVLASTAKGRIFVVLLITWCLFMVAGILEMPLTLIVGFGVMRGEQHVLAQSGMLLVTFLAHTLVSPVAMIGLSLVYFDQRVRQEGLDILLMLGGGAEAGPGTSGGDEAAPRALQADAPGQANEAGQADELGQAGDATSL